MIENSHIIKTIALERARNLLENRQNQIFRVLALTLITPRDNTLIFQESFEELQRLIVSLGDEVSLTLIQKRQKVDPALFIGEGKVQELIELCQEHKIDYVACDRELGSPHIRNLEKLLGIPVIDRTGIILHIFRKNARTHEAKTQIDLAQMQYLSSRLSNPWVAYERQRGGARLKGAGEMQLEIDKRRIKDRISYLKKKLEKIESHKTIQRKMRVKENNIVIVGYTNVGKSTIMNALTDAKRSAKNSLFETLDPCVRALKASNEHAKILITDTVGFIKNLPHDLVASFRSTIQEACHAKLLLHVVDISHPRYQDHIAVTQNILQQIGAQSIPVLYVFNKADSLENSEFISKVIKKLYSPCFMMSAYEKEDINSLKEQIIGFFEESKV